MPRALLPVTKQDLSFLGILKLIFRSVYIHMRWKVFFILAAALLAGGLQTLTPKLLQMIIDLLLYPETSLSSFSFGTLLSLYFLAFLGAAVLSFISGRVVYAMATRIEDYWRYRALDTYYQLPLSWHDKRDSGENGSRMERAGGAIHSLIAEIFGHDIVISFFTLLIVLIVAFLQSPVIGIIFLLPLPLYIFVTYTLSRRIAKGQARLNKLADKAQRTLFDGCANVRTAKAFGRESHEVALYAQRWDKYHREDNAVERIWLQQSIFQTAIEAFSRIAFLSFSVYSFSQGTMTVGQIVMFLTYQQMSFTPLTLLTWVFTRVRRMVKRASQLFDLASQPDSLADKPRARSLHPLKQSFAFDHVSFAYQGKVSALHDVSFIVRRGQTVALVGRSGAGKSTLALLALRFYDPHSGAILWDGQDLRNFTRTSLRKHISYIPQDPTLFHRTIFENIAYGLEHPSRQAVLAAAKMAHAHEFILRTPQGYRSFVGERGVKLSGGQR